MLLDWITCSYALQRLDDYVDRELSAEEMKRVQRHLKICHACTRKFASEAHFVSAMRDKLDRTAVPSDLMNEIARALSQERDKAT